MKILCSAFLAACVFLVSCKGTMIYNNAEAGIANVYEVIAPMRITFQTNLDPTKESYDYLLKEARLKYGDEVDIKNLGKDEVMLNGMSWTVYNFYVIRYSRFE